MSVVYIEGTLQISGLDIKTQAELTELEHKIKVAVLDITQEFNSDVDFETNTKAGDFE